ncbi:unnamed protein product, partial [Rotaria magnacalcarata]
SPDMPTSISTSTSDTSILDDVTFPILSNCDDLVSSKASHIDENEAIASLIVSLAGDLTEHRTTNTETLMHLLKSNVGAGILALPYALSKGGLVFGSIAFWIMGVMTLYCMHQLLRCHEHYRSHTSRSKCDFGDIMRYTLVTCRWRFAQRYAKLGNPVIQVYQLIMLVRIIGFSMIRSLKVLAPFSLAANVITIGGIALVLPVRQKMREPEAYGGCNGVLNTGIYLVTILYFFVVFFFGYIRCDSDARGSISLNLPVDNKLYQFTNIMYAVAIFLTYNLQFYVPFTLLWPRICLTIAALIPNLGLVISLGIVFLSLFTQRKINNFTFKSVGAVASTALSVIFPPICETIT